MAANLSETTATNALGMTNSEPSFLIGTVIGGHYEIISCLGKGGMSTVYKARHVLLGNERAIKILQVEKGNEAKLLQRFQQEAKASFFLSHENIVRVYDFAVEPTLQQPYLVMDCLEGKPLSKVLEAGPLSEERTVNIIAQVCDALQHAHLKGIVHRDIKPANIILSRKATGEELAQIVDFGIAKLINPEEGNDLTQTGEVFGTPLYMSPEQCLGKHVDERSDIYSLGCVMYECLTGRPPFQGGSQLETLMMHVQDDVDLNQLGITAKLKVILHRCLEKNPLERYPAVEILKEDIEAAKIPHSASLSPNIGLWMKNFDKRIQSQRTTRILLVLIVVCLLSSVLVITSRTAQQEKVIVKVPQPIAIANGGAVKKESNLPDDLALRLEYVKTSQGKIDVIEDWSRRNPEFNYFVENELRHLYLGISENKSAQHTEAILQKIRMDDYIMKVLSGWNKGENSLESVRNYLYWAETYPHLPALRAACYMATADEYSKLKNKKKARFYYSKILTIKDKSIEAYKSFAKTSIAALE